MRPGGAISRTLFGAVSYHLDVLVLPRLIGRGVAVRSICASAQEYAHAYEIAVLPGTSAPGRHRRSDSASWAGTALLVCD